MKLDLFEGKFKEDNFLNQFINELKNVLEHEICNKEKMGERCKEMDEYNIYERKKIFLDNQSRNGNELVWIMDENSICLSKNGDGGATSISKIELPKNSKAGEVYENINGKYILNFDLTNELKKIE